MTTATQLQLRRGTATQCDAMTPAEGEPIIDTTNDRLRVGDGTLLGGFVVPNINDIMKQTFIYCTATGTGDAIVLASKLTAYAAGVGIKFTAPGTGTGPSTVNVNALGTKVIKKIKGGVLVDTEPGDIISGLIYDATYNGTVFQLGAASSGNTGAMVLLESKAPTGGNLEFISGFSTDFNSYKIVYEFTSSSGLMMRYGIGAGYVNTGYTNEVNGTASAYTNGVEMGNSNTFYMGEMNIYDGFVAGYGNRRFIGNGFSGSARNNVYATRTDGLGAAISQVAFYALSGGGLSAGRASLYGIKV